MNNSIKIKKEPLLKINLKLKVKEIANNLKKILKLINMYHNLMMLRQSNLLKKIILILTFNF
jgi:predicted 2-oxoglutarate/Fe(II)-dependent dioxygenase YbiX